ncbi:CaiB/BaiF CoA-transferase family protein [Arthrobacter sp. NPDC080031]|uniref:CaiB/BaiF CoA transferase family protein n=1 Tax=Arthrobacter sp. NPDC080031 TaxID=3155918 RepID=UPI00344C14DB
MTPHDEPFLPLSGVKVLDLSTLLPGPLATLMLADAGADVVKLERPGRGDEMRSYSPKLGEASANYALLNRGKAAYAVDFKDPEARDRVLDLIKDADVVVEQFRPGVADRLGLGYAAASAVNPGIIYCSITGYGPEGPYAHKAGHDLNYLAESGLLGVATKAPAAPALPPTVLADIAGGTYPAVVNILLALRRKDRTGEGAHLQISMMHNLQILSYGYIATQRAGGGWPEPGHELLTGGSPRYNIYPTADGRHVAVAALEQKFWERLHVIIGLPPELLDDEGREQQVMDAMQEIFASRSAAHWREVLEGEEVCTVVVNTFEEAVEAGFMSAASSEMVTDGEDVMGALPSPLDPVLRPVPSTARYPRLTPLPTGSVWAEYALR